MRNQKKKDEDPFGNVVDGCVWCKQRRKGDVARGGRRLKEERMSLVAEEVNPSGYGGDRQKGCGGE